MILRPCPYEDAVASAARSGDWSPELSVHRNECLSCAEVTLVAAALAADADELAVTAPPLPDPGMIWLRARLASRQQEFHRATRWIGLVQKVTLACAAAVALAFVPDLWGFISSVFTNLEVASQATSLPRAAGSPTLVLVASMAVLGVLATLELVNLPSGSSPPVPR